MEERKCGRFTSVGTAPGKFILFGEHAVVYGRPALAAPVMDVRATATTTPVEPGQGVWLSTPDLPGPDGAFSGARYRLRDAPSGDPLRVTVESGLKAFLGYTGTQTEGAEPDLLVDVSSSIPVARGLGSGAAVATAIFRSLAGYAGREPSCEQLSELVYQIEVLHHGTPSGIDNTVVTYQQPVFFVRDREITRLRVGRPFTIVIADTGIASSTREVVGDVRRRWLSETGRYEEMFDRIGVIARSGRRAVEEGNLAAIGRLMNQNQEALVSLGVSSPELDGLVAVANHAGAMGAKLSGAGWGGNVIALVEPDETDRVVGALKETGAARVFLTRVR